MYVCVLDRDGKILLHRDMRASPAALLEALEPYRDDLVVGAEAVHPYLAMETLVSIHRTCRAT
jgi:hypothetical protein